MQSNYTNPDDYFANLPADRIEAMGVVRNVIKEVFPEAEETMMYKMPTYMVNDDYISINSQKHYMAIYVCYSEVVEKYAEELSHLNCGKGCIRFKKIEQLPLDTIRKIIKETLSK